MLAVGGSKAVRIEGTPELPVIKEGSRLALAVHGVARILVAMAKLLVMRKGLNIRPLSFPE